MICKPRHLGTLGISIGTLTIVLASQGTALAAPWTPSGPVQVATTSNGPWTLNQGPATLGAPLLGYCTAFGAAGVNTSNTTSQVMQPYYFPFITGSGNNLDGYFDYRVKDQDEALLHGTSSDGGLTWNIEGPKLRLNKDICPPDNKTPYLSTAGDGALIGDNGQGHAVVFTIAGRKLLYTLDREATQVDNAGLLIHDITTGFLGLPDSEKNYPVATGGGTGTPVPPGIPQTTGLQNPDGIFGTIPGTGTDPVTNPLKVIYLKKNKAFYNSTQTGVVCLDSQSQTLTSKTANYDRTELRIASTTDGFSFTDLGALSGLNNPDSIANNGFRFVGPRGTILKYADGTFGMFFSGGNCLDGDSDAYHFIGSAHSSDAVNWVIDNGFDNPLVSVDYSYPTTLPRAYYTGRVYAPNVTLNADGSLRLIWSGYQTGKPLPGTGASKAIGSPLHTFNTTDSANYRAILIQTLVAPSKAPAAPSWAVGLLASGLALAGIHLARRRRSPL